MENKEDRLREFNSMLDEAIAMLEYARYDIQHASEHNAKVIRMKIREREVEIQVYKLDDFIELAFGPITYNAKGGWLYLYSRCLYGTGIVWCSQNKDIKEDQREKIARMLRDGYAS